MVRINGRIAWSVAGVLAVVGFFMVNPDRQSEDEVLPIGSRENCATMPRDQYCDFPAHLEPDITYILGDMYYDALKQQSPVPLDEWTKEVEQLQHSREPKPSVIWLRMADTAHTPGDVP